jgi:hypothetical protein
MSPPLTAPGNSQPLLNPGSAPATTPLHAALPPLNVSGLVVRKAALIAALRIYVPQLGDITALDEQRFLLTLAGSDLGQQ